MILRVSETKQTVVYKKRIPAILFSKEQRRNSNVSVHHSTDEWRAIFDQRIQSGLSVRQWCDQNSMKYDTYKYWEKKIRSFDHAAQTASEPAFVELPDLPQLINSVPPIKIGYRDFQISIQPSADLKQISGVLKLLHSL